MKVAYVLWPGLGIEADEDAFSGTEGGDWVWYPAASSFRPYRLPRPWRAIGPGGAVVGSFSRTGDRVRYIPTGYWMRRGLSEWEVEVDEELSDGPWRQIATSRGSVVLRRR